MAKNRQQILKFVNAALDWVEEEGQRRSFQFTYDSRTKEATFENSTFVYDFENNAGLPVKRIKDLPTEEQLKATARLQALDSHKRQPFIYT